MKDVKDNKKTFIIENFKNPIDFFYFYENFRRGTINDVNDVGEYVKTVGAMQNAGTAFWKNHSFIELFKVYKVEEIEAWTSRRSDFFSRKTTFCLYVNGYRVEDGYIRSLLPKDLLDYESTYNDSTPGSNYTRTDCNVSYLETERFLEKYDLNTHCNYLADRLNTDEYQFGKVEKQTVYHEFGHVFGFYLAEKLGYNLGTIKKIELKNNRGGVTLLNNPYKMANDLTHKEKIREIERIKSSLNGDKKQLLVYFIYILSGAVFNVLYFKRKPVFDDFEQIFINDVNSESYGSYKAKAGDDFNSINICKYDLSWGNEYDFNKFKTMAYELFYTLDKNSIFEALTYKQLGGYKNDLFPGYAKYSILDAFEYLFNGYSTEDISKIDIFLSLIKKTMSNKDNLLIDIHFLLDKYILDIESNAKNIVSEIE